MSFTDILYHTDTLINEGIATLRTGLINGNALMTHTTDTLLPQHIIEITTHVCGNNSIQ